jgi:hypothetical protein
VLGWKWTDRRLHRMAGRLTEGQFAALVDGPLSGRSMTWARVVTLTAAVLLLAGVVAIAVVGAGLFLFGQGVRKLSRHTEVSLFASHPPTGLRAEMLERRPQHPPTVTLDEATTARIDAELGAFPERVRRVLADGGLAPTPHRPGRTLLVVAAVTVLALAGRHWIQM